MKLARWFTFALLALAPASWAQRPYSEREASDYRGQTRMREIHMPQRRDMGDVRKLAQRMDSTMESVQKHADKRSDDMALTRDEAEGLRRLEILFARADAFEDGLEQDSDHPRASVEPFERMLGSYLLVDESYRTLRDAGLLDDDFRRVQSLMDNMVVYYGGFPEYGSYEYRRLLRHGDANVALGFSKHSGLGRADRMLIDLPEIDLDID